MLENVSLAPLTTLNVGGQARYLANIHDEAELLSSVEFARSAGLPIFVLGGGSNLLVADEGFDGVVLKMAINAPLRVQEGVESVDCTAAAGMDWDALVRAASERGWSGVECLAGIPGLVGGTPVQNVGAYGQEVAETIVAVRVLDLAMMKFLSLNAAECGFGYRRSIFNSTERGRYIVTGVTFRLDPQSGVELKYSELKRHFGACRPTPIEVYRAVREIRHGKGMLLIDGEANCRSAGSFFKNPIVSEAAFSELAKRVGTLPGEIPHWNSDEGQVKLAAAWLVEQAGFHKGFAMGRAGISSRHTLALINRGGATAREIIALRDEVQRKVKEKFGIELEQEPVMLG